MNFKLRFLCKNEDSKQMEDKYFTEKVIENFVDLLEVTALCYVVQSNQQLVRESHVRLPAKILPLH